MIRNEDKHTINSNCPCVYMMYAIYNKCACAKTLNCRVVRAIDDILFFEITSTVEIYIYHSHSHCLIYHSSYIIH